MASVVLLAVASVVLLAVASVVIFVVILAVIPVVSVTGSKCYWLLVTVVSVGSDVSRK